MTLQRGTYPRIMDDVLAGVHDGFATLCGSFRFSFANQGVRNFCQHSHSLRTDILDVL